MKATVLGGNGFIGQHLVNHLRAAGWDVWVPSRNDDAIFKRQHGHIFYCIGLTADFRERPFETVEAHVTFLSHVLRQSSFDSFLYLSSTRVYSRAVSTSEESALCILPHDGSDLYNLSKLMGEAICHAANASNVRVARLSNVVGANMGIDNFVGSLCQSAKSGHINLRAHPASEKDYIDVNDVTKLLQLIATSGHERCYNLASGKQLSHLQWLETLQQFFNCTVTTNYAAPIQSFMPINIDCIQNEFLFVPKDVLNALPHLI